MSSCYQGEELKDRAKRKDIELEVVKRPTKKVRIYNEKWAAEWIPIERKFCVLPRRWVVERTFAWIGRNRRMSKDYEYLTQMSEALLYISMTRTMLKRYDKAA